MKRTLLIVVLMASCICHAQTISIDSILQLPVKKIKQWKVARANDSTAILPLVYAADDWVKQPAVQKLKDASITKVELLYSDYPKGDPLTGLNKARLKELRKILPGIFENSNIDWRLVRQTNCTDTTSARALFHGFVISYSKEPPFADRTYEIGYIKSLFDTSFKKDTPKGSMKYGEPPKDSTVIKVLERNHWYRMMVVADVTGSMSPYTAQFLLWLKLQAIDKVVKQFIFFNDGDGITDDQKALGKTGGIYGKRTTKFDEAAELVYKTMERGNGGDIPENNVEALLKAYTMCPDCTNIVMIADNNAPVKDMALARQLNKPIKIIVCGSNGNGVNKDFLNLARISGGSVHTIEDDLTNLMKMKEGEVIKVNGKAYKIISGLFVDVLNM